MDPRPWVGGEDPAWFPPDTRAESLPGSHVSAPLPWPLFFSLSFLFFGPFVRVAEGGIFSDLDRVVFGVAYMKQTD